MRICILSDLHVEFEAFTPPDPLPSADVCVIAGDFGIGGIVPALEWAERHIAPTMRTLIVAGNHDFYRTAYVDTVRGARAAARGMDRVHFLQNDAITLDGVTFLGCTLWTDFQLNAAPELSMFEASKAMSDYRRIIFHKRPFLRFTPARTVQLHRESVDYLGAAMAAAHGAVVVITHHAPSQCSVPDEYRGNRLSPAYASNLEALIVQHNPVLWIHGHIHVSIDYMFGRTRIVSNPRGYPGEHSHAGFSTVIVEI